MTEGSAGPGGSRSGRAGERPALGSPAEAIRWGQAALRPVVADPDLAMRESRWLLEASIAAAGRDPLFARRGPLSAREAAVFRSHIARRARGEPLAYVAGEANFRGLDLFVTPDVLIPRPETEQLVDHVLDAFPEDGALRVLDMGTGSGAIAVSLAVERTAWRVTAVDISSSALDLALRNATRHGVGNRVECVLDDLGPPGPWAFDAIVANLPYVPDDAELPREVREWEPRGALRGGKTGAEIIMRALEMADNRSVGRPRVFFEIGEEQEPVIAARFPGKYSFARDLAGRIRFLFGSV